MVGSLAQAVALVSYGNLFLAGGGDPARLDERNTAFGYVAGLRFVLSGGQAGGRGLLRSVMRALAGPGREVATRTADWFRYLKANNVTVLRLVSLEQSSTAVPLYVATAFAGFSHWVIFTGNDSGALWWSANEQPIQNAGTNQSRIWQVTYTGSPAKGEAAPLADVLAARQELDRMLKLAMTFTRDARLDTWRDRLGDAREQLEVPAPKPRQYPDLLPAKGYSSEARQLLSAASAAWVFGGTGSWNDLTFDRALMPDYERITPALYAAVVNGVITAANAFEKSLL